TYNATTGMITVPAGVTNFAVTVGTVIDNIYEHSETLPLTIGGVTGTGFITDTNVPTVITVEPGAPGVAGNSVPEGTPLVYNVTLSNPSTTTTTFTFALGGGTASANDYTTPPTFDHGVTYNAATGMITVPAGVTNFAVTVGTVIDNVYENSESLPLTIGGVTGTGFITDTNVPTATTVVGNTVDEGQTLTYQVTLSNTSTTATVMSFTLGGQTGVGFASPADYTAPTFTNGVMMNPNGTINVPAGVTSFNVLVPTVNDTIWEPTETLKLTVGSASGIGTIIDNDNHTPTIGDLTPKASGGELTVYEANLAHGTDPNAAALTGQGTFTVKSVDGIAGLTLNGISVIDSSGHFTPQVISTTLNNTLTVTSYDASTGVVSYSYHLNGAQANGAPGAADAGSKFDDITVKLTDPQGDSTTSTLSVNIVDDSPKAGTLVSNTVADHSSLATNLMVVLDLSGSMNDSAGGALSKLAVAKSAIEGLIKAYDDAGDVMVRLVTFNTVGHTLGDGWLTANQAITLINGLANNAGGSATNYDVALKIAESAFTSDAAHKIDGGQNVSYFISDGAPNIAGSLTGAAVSVGIDSAEQVSWEKFLTDNQIVSYAYGIDTEGAGAVAQLAPVAYDGVQSIQIAPDQASVVADLPNALLSHAPVQAGGNLITTANFGADGAAYDAVASVTSGGIVHYADASTHSISFTSAMGGILTVDTHTGAYTYTSPNDVTGNQVDSFTYALQDADHDTTNATLNIAVLDNIQHITEGTAGADTLSGTAQNDYLSGGAGNDFLSGGAGNDILVGGAGDDIMIGGRGSDSMSGGAGADTFRFLKGDQAGSSVPNDKITDFSVAQHDVLDLSDLLQGEHKGVDGTSTSQGNLGNFLNFTKDGANTVLEVHSEGAGAPVDQKITFVNVDLLAGHTNVQLIQTLLHEGNLKTD
ncbi:MAG: type I secretion C-terminal target domain-containing protein, partial [Janthinobacterium lividum]